jgi:ubiquinone biosynthesis protein UbiJ
MPSLWESIKKSAVEVYSSAAERTDELAKVGVRRFDIVGIRRNIAHEMADLGGRVHHMLTEEKNTDVAGDAEVAKHLKSIDMLRRLLSEKEKEIETIKTTAREKRASSTGTGA